MSAMTGYGWSWRLCRLAASGWSALARQLGWCCSPSSRLSGQAPAQWASLWFYSGMPFQQKMPLWL